MNILAQAIQTIGMDEYTKIVVPYAVPNGNKVTYRAWYGKYRIDYHPDDRQLTLYDDDDASTRKPIAYLNNYYHNQLIAAFEKPNFDDDDETQNGRPYIRVEVILHTNTKHLSIQGPLFIVAELYEPEL